MKTTNDRKLRLIRVKPMRMLNLEVAVAVVVGIETTMKWFAAAAGLDPVNGQLMSSRRDCQSRMTVKFAAADPIVASSSVTNCWRQHYFAVAVDGKRRKKKTEEDRAWNRCRAS